MTFNLLDACRFVCCLFVVHIKRCSLSSSSLLNPRKKWHDWNEWWRYWNKSIKRILHHSNDDHLICVTALSQYAHISSILSILCAHQFLFLCHASCTRPMDFGLKPSKFMAVDRKTCLQKARGNIKKYKMRIIALHTTQRKSANADWHTEWIEVSTDSVVCLLWVHCVHCVVNFIYNAWKLLRN